MGATEKGHRVPLALKFKMVFGLDKSLVGIAQLILVLIVPKALQFVKPKWSLSATISRRGKMPMLPSIMLVFTSNSKQAMSSPRSSICAKAISVGSVVRNNSFMPYHIGSDMRVCREP